jgi:ATP-dependent HslUV protease ATP-binding subunit HslU
LWEVFAVDLAPRAIVAGLDKYIIGQADVKKTLAVALSNRERRKRLADDMRHDVMPKNILLVGPTGVGKTEIARRLAGLVDAPFMKVEATRFTEVGYVGKDAESVVHDLVEVCASKVYQDKLREVETKAEKLASDRIVTYLCRQRGKQGEVAVMKGSSSSGVPQKPPGRRVTAERRKRMAEALRSNELEEQVIEIEVDREFEERTTLFSPGRAYDEIDILFEEFNENLRRYTEGHKKRKVRVKEARRILAREEANKLLDFDEVLEESVEQAQDNAVVFVDEIDKLVAPRVEMGRDVSGEGVQRDLLPLVEGTTVMTRYGPVKTDHILFVAAGTFSQSRPSDLIPELQGRFPLQAELSSLTQEEFEKILVEPDNALTKQYEALMATDGVKLTFTQDGIGEIARRAALINEETENIGARRLHTVVEKVLEEVSFSAPERDGEEVVVDAAYVAKAATDFVDGRKFDNYIL